MNATDCKTLFDFINEESLNGYLDIRKLRDQILEMLTRPAAEETEESNGPV